MKSGLEDRNNWFVDSVIVVAGAVSMKSGLEDRNNSYNDRKENYV